MKCCRIAVHQKTDCDIERGNLESVRNTGHNVSCHSNSSKND